jgi:DNA invertase Pin-like site-specific DNA recombinase
MVVRSPEKAGVGGSIPSLATTESTTYRQPQARFCSNLFQNPSSPKLVSNRFGTVDLAQQGQTSSTTSTPSSPARITLGLPLPDSWSRKSRCRPPLRAAVYVCCSTAGKRARSIPKSLLDPATQQTPLLEILRLRQWTLHRIYIDQLTGDKRARPGFSELMEDARNRRFDVIVVAGFARLAPNLKRLVFTLDEFSTLGIGLVSRKEGLDTTSLLGGAVMVVVQSMVRLERNAVGRHIKEGLDHARQQGTASGRPIGRPRREFDASSVTKLRERGWSYRRIADELGIGLGTVTRALRMDD